MSYKTRKTHHKVFLEKQNKIAKKGTQLKCRMKTCRAKKYQSVYGAGGGTARTTRNLFF